MRIALFSTAILFSGCALAAAPIDGLYSSLFAGYSYVPDNITTTYYGLMRNRASYNSGYNVGGRLGYKSHPLRYEGELTFIGSHLGAFNVNQIPQTGVDGYFNAVLGMANIYYDFPEIVPCVAPFLSAGLGYARVQAELKSTAPLGATYFKGSGNVFAYQASAGFIYNFVENYSLDLAYRYLTTERAGHLGKVVQANLASVGITYRFDESNYK